ncbi:hypothetical protein NFJ02_16g25650 [Pycnococcus provasolii]
MESAAVGLIDSRTANGIAARIGLKGATNVAPPLSAGDSSDVAWRNEDCEE